MVWRKLICNNYAPPKCTFILWLCVLGRLSTCDNMLNIGVVYDPLCCLCKKSSKSIAHLFFDCEFSGEIWSYMLQSVGIQRTPGPWHQEFHFAITTHNSNSSKNQLFRMVLAIYVYLIGKERNYRNFRNVQKKPADIGLQIQLIIYSRCLQFQKLQGLVP